MWLKESSIKFHSHISNELNSQCPLESLHKLRKMLDKFHFVAEAVQTAAKLARSLAPLLSVWGVDMVCLVIAAVVVCFG